MMARYCAPVVLLALAGCGMKKPGEVSDADLRRAVEQQFQATDPDRASFHLLLEAGKRADPFVIQALDDPRTAKLVFHRTRFDITGNSPFHRFCGLLSHTAPPAAVKPLIRYLDHPDVDFRCEAAQVLAAIGTAECVEPVKKALADPERRVRQYALEGILGGLREQRRHAEFADGVFDAVAALLRDGAYDIDGPAVALATMNFDRAAPLLESPEFFTTRNPQLRDVLSGLSNEGHRTPHAILLPLLKELAPLAATDGRRAHEFAAGLRLYARNPDAAAEAEFRGLLESESEPVAMGAAGALEILAGVDPDWVVTAGDHGKFGAMTVPQRYFYAVSLYHFEVCNGGHDQYFGNSSGDIYPTALEGLRAIGACTKASILEGALRAFAPQRALTDRVKRRAQMDLLSDASDLMWKSADAQYYESEKNPKERVEVLLAIFAVRNRAEFTKR
jgi:HEAT repeat protein